MSEDVAGTISAKTMRDAARHIIERDAHVSWTDHRAAWHVIRRLRPGVYERLPRKVQRAIWHGARVGMERNRKLYAIAMGSI